MTTGSTGQTVPHPLLATEAQLRKEVEGRLSTLHLIDAGQAGMGYDPRQLTPVTA